MNRAVNSVRSWSLVLNRRRAPPALPSAFGSECAVVIGGSPEDAQRHTLVNSLCSELVAADKLCVGQREVHDDLAVAVEVAGRHEPEPLVEPGRSAVLGYVAGQQLCGPGCMHALR